MQDRIIMNAFRNLCKEAFPAEITTTVTGVNGSQVTVAANLGGTATWVGGIIQFVGGQVDGFTAAIANNTDHEVITAGCKFVYGYAPQVGDTVKISGGYLPNARIYIDDPDSIRADIDSGKRFFITLNSIEGDVSFRTLAGQTVSGEGRLDDFYGFEFTVETPYVTGTPSIDDVKRIQQELPTLRDQILALVFNFVLNPENRVQLIDKVAWGRVLIRRPGSEKQSRGYVIEFDLGVL